MTTRGWCCCDPLEVLVLGVFWSQRLLSAVAALHAGSLQSIYIRQELTWMPSCLGTNRLKDEAAANGAQIKMQSVSLNLQHHGLLAFLISHWSLLHFLWLGYHN
jgi:hypothetical protein